MLIGRFLMIVPIMALAGSLVQKKVAPASAGTFPGFRRHVSHSAARHGPACRRAEFSPGAGAGTDGRAFPRPARENSFESDLIYDAESSFSL